MSKQHTINDYQIIKKIGTGSFSNVYSAKLINNIDNEKSVEYAIKVISTRNLNSKVIENIENEIDIMVKIKHDNIITLHESIVSKSHLYIVLEYCDGGDLYKYIKKNGKISEMHTKYFFIKIGKGLYFLHQNNLIHRDLKPQNILLTSNSEVKIADFGFVKKYTAENNMLDTLCGSPIYMAPEILKYNKYDAKVDLWSMGIILFEMLAGKPPFTAKNHIHLLRIIETTDFVLPFDVSVSDDCMDLLKSLIVVNPKYRITFNNFFKHPFFDNYDFKDEEYSLVLNSINNTTKTNDEDSSCFLNQNDINFLKNEEEKSSFDNEIMFDIKSYIESIYRSASEVGYISYNIYNNYDSISLYTKALNLLSHAISVCEKTFNKIKISRDTLQDIYSKVKYKFCSFLILLEEENGKIKNLKESQSKKIKSAEEIIYYKGLEFIKKGASYELLEYTSDAINFYVWGLRLLQSLTMDEKPLDDHDQKIIDNYVLKVNERLNCISSIKIQI